MGAAPERRSQLGAFAALGLLLPALCACPSRGTSASAAPDSGPSSQATDAPLALPANAIPVPLVRQKVNYSCGDVATLALLRYWDPADYASVPETALYAPLLTTERDGTDPAPMARYLSGVRAPALTAELRFHVRVEELMSAIDRREPPIVDFQAWKDEPRSPSEDEWAADWDDGHYAVLVGYDARELYFMDPSTSDHYAYVPVQEFVARWHDVLTGSNEHIEHATIFVHASVAPVVKAGMGEATRLL
ncbi:MAG: C39 family peptidase [Polyangiaceae bacterium]